MNKDKGENDCSYRYHIAVFGYAVLNKTLLQAA